MGNQQSVPHRTSLPIRPTNKLSKPRTNSHSAQHNGRSSVAGSRVNSFNTATLRLSTLDSESWAVDADADGRPAVPPKPKRRSLFSRVSSRKQEEINAEADGQFSNFESQNYSEPILDRYSIQQRSRASSVTRGDFQHEPPVRHDTSRPNVRDRTHRWSAQPNPSPQQHNLQHSDVQEQSNPATFVNEEQLAPRYNMKRTSTGLHSITSSIAPPEEEYMASRYDPHYSGGVLSSRTNSDTAMHGPIRRRSLQQHGVVTRMGNYEPNARQSMPTTRVPSSDKLHQYEQPQTYTRQTPHFQASQAIATPVAQLEEALDSIPTYTVLRPSPQLNIDTPRTETPTELDYGQTGAFKLGTLRIVNGSASPVPSERTVSVHMDKDDEEDYLTMGDNSHSKSQEDREKDAAKSLEGAGAATLGVPRKISREIPHKSPIRNLDTETTVMSVDTQSLPLSALNFEPLNFTMATNHDFKTDSKNDRQVRTRSVEIRHQDSVRELERIKTSILEFKHRDDVQDVSALSPFSFTESPRIMPRLEVSSKHTAIEDSLFEGDPETPLEVGIPRSDSDYRPGGAEALPQKVKTVKGPRDLVDKPLAKADSGYSSNASTKSFKKDKKDQMRSVPAKDSRMEELIRVASKTSETYSFTSSTSSKTQLKVQRSLPALPHLSPSPPLDQSRKAPSVPSKESLRRFAAAAAPSLGMRKSSTKKQKKSKGDTNVKGTLPQDPHINISREASPALSEMSTTCSDSTAPTTAASSTSSRWRLGSKLKHEKKSKAEPETHQQSSAPFTIQAFRNLSDQLRVPKPSAEAKLGLEVREKGFPVNNFRNTVPLPTFNPPPSLAMQLRRTASKETLGTIFSVGTMEVREELDFARTQKSLPAVPVEETIPEDPPQPTTESTQRTRRERSDTVVSTWVKTQGENSPAGPLPHLVLMPRVQYKKKDWGRRSLLANFSDPNPPDSPPKTVRSPLKLMTRGSLEPIPMSKIEQNDASEVQEAARSSQEEARDSEPSRIHDNHRDFEQDTAQSSSAPPLTSSEPVAVESSNLDSHPQPHCIESVQAAPEVRPEEAPENRTRSFKTSPSLVPICARVSVPALRSLYDGPDSVPSMIGPIPSPVIEKDDIEPETTAPHRKEAQRQEWRRRSSNASAKDRESYSSPEPTHDLQGPTDSHNITSIKTYAMSEAFRSLSKTPQAIESLSRPMVSSPAEKSEHTLMSNESATSSRRSLRHGAYPPQAHANRRNLFPRPQIPQPLSSVPLIADYTQSVYQTQQQTCYDQIDNESCSGVTSHQEAQHSINNEELERQAWEQSQNYWARRRRQSAENLRQSCGSGVGEGIPSTNMIEYRNIARQSAEGGRPTPGTLARAFDKSSRRPSYSGAEYAESPEQQSPASVVMAKHGLEHDDTDEIPLRRLSGSYKRLHQADQPSNSPSISRPQMSRQKTTEPAAHSQHSRQRSESSNTKKRRKSVGFALQPWETARSTADQELFLRKRQSMDQNSQPLTLQARRSLDQKRPEAPIRYFSIDTLPSQTGQTFVRRASPSPVIAQQDYFSPSQAHTATQRPSIEELPWGAQQVPVRPQTLVAGSHRSFDPSQLLGHWKDSDKQAWAAQQNDAQPMRSLERYDANDEFTQSYATIPKSIGSYYGGSPDYLQRPGNDSFPSPSSAPQSSRRPLSIITSPNQMHSPSFEESQRSPRLAGPNPHSPFASPRTGQGDSDEMLVIDRYSGGLGYNFSPGLGIHGSTGVGRSGGGQARSVGQRRMYGVDLGDVPVMVEVVRGRQ